ncbi:Metallo-dependent phosphatase-like protein [Schizothecium vesticola]|uniref:Metallo-dependent phosphatase-like protein n=1 Tax=Schizothecium vesticola TaxID=314040 RepID=A0AA40K953_9PEZI|nr:Metallo-dependent phosphatase-like protein [Schizothecium vesticola]
MLFAGFLALSKLVCWKRQSESSAADQIFGPLQFQSDGTFQLSIFEDLHFGENSWTTWGSQQDLNTVKVMNQILDAEPTTNLVVLNGDLITGENVFFENGTHYLDQIVAPLLSRNLTWASTYGNHDSSYNLSRDSLLAREQRWPNARTTQMVSASTAGVSNYYLPVYPASCTASCTASCPPALLLWFFDSRGGHLHQQHDPTTGALVGQPDWVDESVVSWFQATNAALVDAAGGTPIPALAFVHIPTNASLAAQERGVNPRREPGIDDDAPVAQQGQGWCADGVDNGTCAYGGQDGPFMAAVAGTEGMVALFSGHDHGNTWCYRWEGRLPGMEVEGKGVNLCFGQHSGYGGYGNWIRGARQVVVSRDAEGEVVVETYVRLESGAVVGAVTLNDTYGQDRYPETPNDKTRCPTCS